MLIRSKRAPLHSTQNAELGPGCYNPHVPDYRPKAGSAPFGSTSERAGLGSNSYNPGPGEYEVNLTSLKLSNRPFPQFISKESRIARDTSTSLDVPGPGAYAPEVVREPVPPVQSKKLHSASGINWVKVATAPSIPSHVQSYGYQEGPRGELVQLPLPVQGYTGAGEDKPGPGHYNPSDKLFRPSKRVISIGKVSGRKEQTPSAVPGPGTYDADATKSSEVFHGGIMANRPLSMFASTTTRKPLMVTMYGPGPGAYKPASTFTSLREHLAVNPESYHAFGSSDMRPRGDPPAGLPNLGPGAYDAAVLADSKEKHGSAAFVSKAERFAASNPSLEARGPGTYESDATSLVTAVSKKLKGRFGVFGTTSSRFEAPREETRPTPASYDPRDTNPAELRRKDKRSPAFRPSGVREDPTHKLQGANTFYEAKKDWPKPTTQSTHFVSSVPRFAPTTKDFVPGPGKYAVPSAIGTAPGGAGWSKSARFDNGATDVPGPGHYNVHSSMHKKTFNITIGDSWE
jgi:hypothetical protein